MLLPATLYFLVFSYIPMAGIVIAFKQYTYSGGLFGSPWIGFENFRFLFMTDAITKAMRNTVLYNTAFIIINNFFAMVLAIFLAELKGKLFKKVAQSATLFPYFISWVVVGAFVYNIFNYEYGMMNSLLTSLGFDRFNVYDKPAAWIFIITSASLWKHIGYYSIIYLAAVSGIDQEMYEAAEIDGANIFQRIYLITIPMLYPTMFVLILLSIGQIFRGDFSMFYQIVGDNAMVYGATDVIDTFVIRSLNKTREFGMTSAAGVVQSVLCFVIVMVANHSVRKFNSEYSLY